MKETGILFIITISLEGVRTASLSINSSFVCDTLGSVTGYDPILSHSFPRKAKNILILG